MSKECENSFIVGQLANGEPLTKAVIKERVIAASKRVKSGDYIAHEEVEQEIKKC
jgi:hypothetical protein